MRPVPESRMTTQALLALADKWDKSAGEYAATKSQLGSIQAGAMIGCADDLRRALASQAAGVGID